jgi:hypothetical protein
MHERFIPTEEFSHLNNASLVLVDHLKGCEALVQAKMDVDHVNLKLLEGSASAIRKAFWSELRTGLQTALCRIARGRQSRAPRILPNPLCYKRSTAPL